MHHIIFEYRKVCAKIEFHKDMVKLITNQISKTPCTEIAEKKRLYQAKYYHGRKIVELTARAHDILDRKVVKNHA